MDTLGLLHSGEQPDLQTPSLLTRLMVVTHFVQKQTMDRLLEDGRYEKLSLAYADYIALLAERDYSPGEIAERLGVSKQVCSKMVGELESLDLLGRRVNPQDSRSRVLSLSAKGLRLLRDGIEAANGIQTQMADTIGVRRLGRLVDVLGKLCVAMGIELPAHVSFEDTVAARAGSRPTRLAGLLPRLSEFFRRQLAASVTARGFSDLRPGVGQVLGMINRDGRRLQYIASVLGISKQSVAATAAELDQQGYVTREADPQDHRQIIIRLSPRGRELMREVITSVDDVEATIRAALSEEEFQLLDEALTAFYSGIAGHYDSASVLRNRIQQLSRQLVDELGATGARALAQQLMTMTRGTR